jgi:hypothetical protein
MPLPKDTQAKEIPEAGQELTLIDCVDMDPPELKQILKVVPEQVSEATSPLHWPPVVVPVVVPPVFGFVVVPLETVPAGAVPAGTVPAGTVPAGTVPAGTAPGT